jgi:AcrR family transcriptional regulator
MSGTKLEGSPRERLLAAANELFYAEGIHTVGIDRLIERAGVAKASLYSSFGGKEELVRAYLQARAEARRARISSRLARYDEPRARILGIFDLLGEAAREPTYRGCPFVNASAEGAREENAVSQVCLDSRVWMRELFTSLAADLGVRDAEQVGRQLAILYDGAVIGAAMERSTKAVAEARDMARALLDAEAPPAGGTSSASKTARKRPPRRAT